jgi:hypothetical protein
MTSSAPAKKFDAMGEDWRELSTLKNHVIDNRLTRYVKNELPPSLSFNAVVDCLPAELPKVAEDSLMMELFFPPLFLFNWINEEKNTGLKHFNPKKTVAENYLQRYESTLKTPEKQFIEAMRQTYYSFYSILDVRVDQSLELQDLLQDTVHTVKEWQATQLFKRGEILFTRLLTLNEQSILVGTFPVTLPANSYPFIEEFKEQWLTDNRETAWTPQILRKESRHDLLDYFFERLKSDYAVPSNLVNSDKDDLQFVVQQFKLSVSIEQALQQLLPLTLVEDTARLLTEAQKSSSGAIQSIEIPWYNKRNPTENDTEKCILGHIRLENRLLTLETNSQARAKKGRNLLKKYLGEAIVLKNKITQSPEEKFASWVPVDPKKEIAKQSQAKKVAPVKGGQVSPELQAHIKTLMRIHQNQWLDEPIAALQNKTPRQAAKTVEGREQLKMLLLQLESQNQYAPDASMRVDIHFLKNQLGLK